MKVSKRNLDMTYDEKNALYESIMKEVAQNVKKMLNESFLSSITKKLYKLSKKYTSTQDGNFILYVNFKNSTGSENHVCSFSDGKLNDKIIPINRLTDDCFEGGIVFGEEFKKLKERVREIELKYPGYDWENAPSFGYIGFGKAPDYDIFGVWLSEKGVKRIQDIVLRQNCRGKNCDDFFIEQNNELKRELRMDFIDLKKKCNALYREESEAIIKKVVELSKIISKTYEDPLIDDTTKLQRIVNSLLNSINSAVKRLK